MATVSVDVELWDFDTDDLVDELMDRIGKPGKRTGDLPNAKKKEMIEAAKAVLSELAPEWYPKEEADFHNSLEDELKFYHFKSVFNKYTITQLQALIP